VRTSNLTHNPDFIFGSSCTHNTIRFHSCPVGCYV